MTKFIKYLLVVIVGFLICDFSISFVVEKLIKNKYHPIIYSTYNTQSDIAIFGASRASHHYVPSVLKDSLYLTAYNYGMDGRNIYVHYLLLKMLLENTSKKPCLVILELGAIDINDTPKWNEEKLNELFPYYYSEKCVRDLLSDVLGSEELFVVNFSGLYRHNSNGLSYLKWVFKGFPQRISIDGYVPLYKQWNEPLKQVAEHGKTTHPKKLEYIEKFIDLCKQEGIYLILTASPTYMLLPEKQNWVDEVERIAERKNIPFYYHEKESIFLSHREWFNEPVHLNDDGAQIYSRIISSEIKNNKDLILENKK